MNTEPPKTTLRRLERAARAAEAVAALGDPSEWEWEDESGSYRPWSKWFAWRPVRASGRWRWLVWVERRRVDEERGIQTSYLPEEWPFEYRLPEQVS